MTALPPKMNVIFGVSDSDFIDMVKTNMGAKDIHYESLGNDLLHFRINEYNFYLTVTNFSKEIPALLNLPYSRK